MSSGAAGLSQGLRAGRSSGRTKLEYTGASGRHDHVTFRSGPTRQSDDRDSEPDYLLRPTRHGPGGVINDQFERFFLVQLTAVEERRKQPSLNLLLRVLSSKVHLRFESLINTTQGLSLAAI